jgi:uncharacterized protein (DUF2336 family)
MQRKEDDDMTTVISENEAAHADKIVRRLEDFPELMQALRGGDLLTGRLLCAEVFNFYPGARFASASDGGVEKQIKTHIKMGSA